ncbi:MAG: hypothetical protein L3J37_00200 [Rhodobacteraceae bacterium]|nr:hypothetical protein [Paracoccaceae bacterium]
MDCPFCMPDEKINMTEGICSTPELKNNGHIAVCPDCGFSISAENVVIVAVAVITLQRHLGDVIISDTPEAV